MTANRALKQITASIQSELQDVEHRLQEEISAVAQAHSRVNKYTEFSDAATTHVLRARGKRLRPTLLLLAAKCVRGEEEPLPTAVLQLAVATEIVHNASLVHDDVIDEAGLRRMRRSVNARYGNKVAILAGNVLYAHFFSLLEELDGLTAEKRLNLLRLFTAVTKQMCFGEMHEERMRAEKQAPSFDDYLAALNDKTAVLVAVSCEAGAIAADAPPWMSETLRDFGHDLGMAYQLLDDIADGDSPYGNPEQCSAAAKRYLEGARASLDQLPDSEAARGLSAMIDYIQSRSHIGEPVKSGA